MDRFLPYAQQSISAEDLVEVSKSLQSEMITRGPYVTQFEENLKKETGAEYCVVMNSGSTALEACYFAAEGNESDRILSTPNTFVASLTGGIKRGMTPIFVDIDRSTGNVNLDQVMANLDYPSSRGRLFFVPVHFSGIAVDMKKIDSKIKNPYTIIIEDAAHALGSRYPSGEKVGSCAYSDMTILSFHPAKTITTGEGGAVLTNNPYYYERLKLFRNNGIVRHEAPWDYSVEMLTGNFNFTEFQAALGLSQLKRISTFIEKRRRLVKRYRQNLKNYSKVRLFTDAYDDQTAYHLFVIQTEVDRTKLMQALKEKNIGSQFHYIPVYQHPFFERYAGNISEYFPEMEAYAKSALSLPLYFELEESDVDYICNTLKLILDRM